MSELPAAGGSNCRAKAEVLALRKQGNVDPPSVRAFNVLCIQLATRLASPDCVRLRAATGHCLLGDNLKGQAYCEVMTQRLRPAERKPNRV
jgi:hypothetical protein